MKRHINKLLALLAVATALLHFTLTKIPKETEVHFLNVGQGDAILVVTPQLHTILIDGGPGETVLGEIGSILPFFARDIDLMVLSHPHRDHMEGLLEVLQRYRTRHILMSGDQYGSSMYREFLKLARAKEAAQGLQVHFAKSTTDVRVEDLIFDILHPIDSIAGKTYENTNNASVVMRMQQVEQYHQASSKTFLFTGDCEEECEHEILGHYPASTLHADVLKVGHHGSRTSTTQAFLNAVAPQIAVIQSEAGNQFEHPHPETLQKLQEAGVEVRRNDVEGTFNLPISF